MKVRAIILVAVAWPAIACGVAHTDAASRATTTIITATTTPASTVWSPPTKDPYPDSPLIDHVEWITNSAGRQLQIFPTAAGRHDFFAGARDRAWHEVLAHAPTADTPGMRDQLYCHWDWAPLVQPDKPTWDLEPWRPDVGYDATVQALCNPGGAEDH